METIDYETVTRHIRSGVGDYDAVHSMLLERIDDLEREISMWECGINTRDTDA